MVKISSKRGFGGTMLKGKKKVSLGRGGPRVKHVPHFYPSFGTKNLQDWKNIRIH
jgi:hypothetical protein